MENYECAEGERRVGGHRGSRGRGGVEKTHLVEEKKRKRIANAVWRITNASHQSWLIKPLLTRKRFAYVQLCIYFDVTVIRTNTHMPFHLAPFLSQPASPSLSLSVPTSSRCFCGDPNKWCQRCNFKLQYRRKFWICIKCKIGRDSNWRLKVLASPSCFCFVTCRAVDRLQANHRIS